MPIGCDDVKTRMMELLYGELAGSELATVEAHLGGCERCQAELAGFKRTRAALRGSLEQAPPPGVRENILRAAEAAVRQQPAAVVPRRARPAPAPERAPLWDWLRRRWAFPTLATIGAVAVFLLASQMFLRPEKMMEGTGAQYARSRPPQEEPLTERLAAPAAPAAPAAAPSPSVPEAAAEPIGGAQPLAGAPAAADRRASVSETSRNTSRRRLAAPKRDAPAATGGDVAWGGGAGGLKKQAGASADHRIAKETTARETADEAPADKGSFAEPPPPRPPSPVAAQRQDRAPAGPPAPAKVARKDSRQLDDLIEGGNASSSAPVPAPRREEAEEAPTTAMASRVRAEAESDTESKTRAKAKAKAASPAAAPAPTKGFNETPAQRADRLFAGKQWAAAAAAYRQLLQGDPRNASAVRWRHRLATAEENLRRSESLETPP